MDIKQTYNEWLENAVEDKDLKAELESIKNNEDEIYDRFYTALKLLFINQPITEVTATAVTSALRIIQCIITRNRGVAFLIKYT